MDLKNIFKRGKKISKFDFRKNYVKSKTTQGFFENEKISQIFDRRAEKDELNQALYEKSKGGLTKTEMKEVIGGLKTLTKRERYEFAKAVFPSAPSGKRFIRPSKNTNQNSASGNTGVGRQSSFIRSRPKKVAAQTTTSQMTPVQMATFRNRIRNLSKEEGGEQAGGSFSRALEAMRKNKRN